MIIKSTRLGEFEICARDLVCFPEGFSGLPEWQEGVLVPVNDVAHFFWLQFTHDSEAAFLLLEVEGVISDFDLRLAREAATVEDDAKVYAIVRVPHGDLKQATVNLLAPVIIRGTPRREGFQVILHDSGYPLRHPLFVEDVPC